jgi:hypothetical protein
MNKNSMLFAALLIVLVVALVGGTWTASKAEGTVSPTQPAKPTPTAVPTKVWTVTNPQGTVPYVQPVKPVALAAPTLMPSGFAMEQKVKDPSQLFEMEVKGVGKMVFPANTLKRNEVVRVEVLEEEDIPHREKILPITEVFELKAAPSDKFKIEITLSQAEVDKIMANANISLLWYHEAKEEWVRLPATLKDNVLTVEAYTPGIFTVGILK